MTTRRARALRGQFVAAFATVVAAFSHGTADGGNPAWPALVLALAFSSVACVFLASARLSHWRLGASVALSQLAYHGLFSLFGPASSSGGAIASHHHGVVVFAPVSGAAGASGFDAWMLGAHLAAGALTFVVLLRGDQAIAAIGRLATLVLALLLRRVPQPVQSAPRRILSPSGHRATVPHRSRLLSSSLSHRGPPRTRFA